MSHVPLLWNLCLFILWAAVAWLALAPLRPLDRRSIFSGLSKPAFFILFLSAVFLTLLACRLSALIYPYEINVDEAQFIAQALGYGRSWLPFSQDSNTSGPLNCYILTWPLAFGLPITYFTARLTGLAFILLTLFFSLKSTSLIVGRRWTYLLSLSLISFYCFAYQSNFVHYSSEYLPTVLLAAATWLITRIWKRKPASVLLLGLILGAIPFTKLQAAPLAIYLFCLAAALLSQRPPKRLPSLSPLLLGGITLPFLITLPLLITGKLPDAWHRYITANLSYSSETLLIDHPTFLALLQKLVIGGVQFTLYFAGMMTCAAIGLLLIYLHKKKLTPSWLLGLIATLAYLLTTCAVVLKPYLGFSHYLLLLLLPTLLLVSWIARGCLLFCPRSVLQKNRPIAILLLLLLSFLSLPLHLAMQIIKPFLADLPENNSSLVSAYIKTVTNPADTLAIWGYTPEYYVETQLPPATQDYSAFHELLPGPENDYYRNGYIADLKRTMPRVIVDSVGEWHWDGWPPSLDEARATHYPPLAQLLADHYRLAAQITTNPAHPPVFIYVRND